MSPGHPPSPDSPDEAVSPLVGHVRELSVRIGSRSFGEREKLKEAGEDIDSGDIDAALESSREAWDAAERNANRVLSDAFSRAQSALIFAEAWN